MIRASYGYTGRKDKFHQPGMGLTAMTHHIKFVESQFYLNFSHIR
jgi:hypothetical protein